MIYIIRTWMVFDSIFLGKWKRDGSSILPKDVNVGITRGEDSSGK